MSDWPSIAALDFDAAPDLPHAPAIGGAPWETPEGLALKPGYVLGLEAAHPVNAPQAFNQDWRYGVSVTSRF